MSEVKDRLGRTLRVGDRVHIVDSYDRVGVPRYGEVTELSNAAQMARIGSWWLPRSSLEVIIDPPSTLAPVLAASTELANGTLDARTREGLELLLKVLRRQEEEAGKIHATMLANTEKEHRRYCGIKHRREALEVLLGRAEG